MNKLRTKTLLSLALVSIAASGIELLGQASTPKVNNEKSEKGGQAKRIHPHALKLILQGNKEEAISYLEKHKDNKVNPKQTQMLIDLALDKPNAWKFDAETWPFAQAGHLERQVYHRLWRWGWIRATPRADVGHYRSNRPASLTPARRQCLHRRPHDS
ncbi:MAG: hypothetical protein ACKVJ1_02755 [Verrucomicrobiia bacterium]